MTTAAERTRRWRERRKAQLRIYRLALPDEVLGALLDSSRLTEREALRRRSVEAALSEVLLEWSQRWSSELSGR